MHKWKHIGAILVLIGSTWPTVTLAADEGRFVKTTWVSTKGNDFRVNGPQIPQWAKERWEGKQTGLMRIELADDPAACAGGELYLELWGGHPGVSKKRFTLNGRRLYYLPEVGAERHHCTYSYPTIPLNPGDLRNGINELQFACDGGNTFWAHYLIRAAGMRLVLPANHAAVGDLSAFEAKVRVEPGEGETLRVNIEIPDRFRERIAAVDYWGHYRGYDENGNGVDSDWHGFTKDRLPFGHLGTVGETPFALNWDVRLLPDQTSLGVRAVVRFKDRPNLAYETAPVESVAFPRRTVSVQLVYSTDVPRPFWSRAKQARTCSIILPQSYDPANVEQASLQLIIWDGGRGDTPDPFTLNGQVLAVAGAGAHDVLYRILPIDPQLLRPGRNEVRVLSDTEHHGLEVLAPGPALVIRFREGTDGE